MDLIGFMRVADGNGDGFCKQRRRNDDVHYVWF